MTVLENKLQNIYNKLSTLILQLKKICVNKINNIPTQIERIVIGQDKLKIYIDQSEEYEIDENDLSGCISIVNYAFYKHTNLTSVTIPDSITNIGTNAFNECTNLTNMYMYSPTPPTLGGAAIPATTTIHVPIGSGDVYKSATNWSSFADKIVEDIEI